MAAPEQSPPAREPISPAKRRMLQQQFEHGSKSAAKGQFDYATEMFSNCVTGDPGNQIYAQNFLANLQKFYNNNKTGARMASIRGAGARGTIKKCEMQKDWPGVIKQGVELLKLNPWDVSALTTMANACEQMHCDEAQLVYLKAALDVQIKDPEVNRLYARALANQGQFDQAIVAWNRVLQAKPGDPEARKEISNCTVQKTIHRGGYEDAQSSTDVMQDQQAKLERLGAGGTKISPEQQLEKAIAKNPTDLDNYNELANLYTRDERFAEAEDVLTRALQVSGGDISLRERLEDVQIRRARQQVAVAEKKAREEKTPEAEQLWKDMLADLNAKELEIYRARAERYPSHLGFKYELAVRMQKAGQHNEAIKLFQEARGDSKRKAAVMLALGESFFAIKQYKLALSNFEAAVQESTERDMDQKKLALYNAGRLALGLKDFEKAENYLTELAGLDFGYKDVSKLLDKLNELRDNG